MTHGVWIAVAVALPLAMGVVVGISMLRRRAAGSRSAMEISSRRADQAIRALEHRRRKTARGDLRGKGEGGDFKTASDAAFGSDTTVGA
jgi:hypothetical protein